jgi:S-adenosylmethionine-diacylglycerol 3-amino-3-carboxypropyl transferase
MAAKIFGSFTDRFEQAVFNTIYSRALVYNACWEDPAVDRLALNIGADDTMLVITSAGCNALDYALTGPRRIHAVDSNPRQNALLELKLAGIRRLEFEDFFAAFGSGYHPRFGSVYRDFLRGDLSLFARTFWDNRVGWFGNPRAGFYYQGLSGIVARLFRSYLRVRPRLSAGIAELFDARSLDDQRHLYDTRVKSLIWTPSVNWTLSRQLTMNLLGVPPSQTREVQGQHERGVAGFVRDSIEYVFRQLPVWTNYFWSVYVRGHYAEDCCPEYLKRDNFHALKAGLADRIRVHTSTVTEFLKTTNERVSKFVLLDHMDWMSSDYPEALAEEWYYILRRATLDARIIFRSAHATPAYLEHLELGAGQRRLSDHLTFHRDLAAGLQRRDRVHTYAGFHVADVTA